MATAQELIKTQVARFVDRRGDWDAFADAREEGYRRAQHRFRVSHDKCESPSYPRGGQRW